MNPSPNAVDQDERILSDNARPLLHCHRCGYDWTPQGEIPRQCALCRSAYWQRPLPFTDPDRIKEYQAKAQEKAQHRRKREDRGAKVRRLQKIARKLGPESVDVIKRMFPESLYFHGKEPVMVMKPLPNPLPWEKPAGMPPPPKFEDQE